MSTFSNFCEIGGSGTGFAALKPFNRAPTPPPKKEETPPNGVK